MEIKVLTISLIFFIILYTVCRLLTNGGFIENFTFGYLTTALNFMLMSRKLRKVFSGNINSYNIVGYFFRLVFILLLYVVWFKNHIVNIWGLLVGISLIPFTIPLIVIIEERRKTDGAST
ncbi:ATP synthase subunit I [Deferribacter abyssi]|uniref:ATP synthase subunit I n=1 Tax=Deferribacter abyssi TaxID=213806 RepID=UPI003C248285